MSAGRPTSYISDLGHKFGEIGKDRGARTPAMALRDRANKFRPGRGDLWDLALTTFFLMAGGEPLTKELSDS